MMYQDGLAFAVKVGGKVLREFGGAENKKVYVPFGSEYSLLVKNQKSQRVLVHVSIDGQPIDTGAGFIIDANSEGEFERFVKSLSSGNKFKFIERTEKIENGPRGIKIDDGLIRIEFQYEKRAPIVEYDHVYRKTIVHDHVEYWPDNYWYPRRYLGPNGGCFGNAGGDLIYGARGGLGSGSGGMAQNSADMVNSVNSVNYCSVQTAGSPPTSTFTMSTPMPEVVSNDAGITVGGSESKQVFQYGYIGALETETYSMIIQLVGATAQGKQVKQAFTVKHKVSCQICETENKHDSKFCSHCGAGLVEYA